MARVMIIDDSDVLRRVLREILRQAGHDALEARDGEEGLSMIELHRPDCVLLDLSMPRRGGLEVLQALHEAQSRVPVIVLTAGVEEPTRQRCLRLGAREVLLKPDGLHRVNRSIGRVLAAAEGHAE